MDSTGGETSDSELTVQAVALLRGDLPALRADTYRELDAALAQAVDQDPVQAAKAVLALLEDEPDLAARLRTFTREVAADTMVRANIQPPPGAPQPTTFTIWKCPKSPEGHFRKVQREAHQDMGECTEHGEPLVPEGS